MDQPTEPVIGFFQEAWSHFFDKDKKGIISSQDFASMINTMMVAVGRPNDAVIQHMINEVEADSSGTMDFSEVLDLDGEGRAEHDHARAGAQEPM